VAQQKRSGAAELIGRIATGDEAGLADLYQCFAPMLFGLALKMMRDRKDAEHVLQEGFLYIWRKAAAYDPQLGGPFSWAVRIVRNIDLSRLFSSTSSLDFRALRFILSHSERHR
jgi:RNA polymerase sigma-70 factor (ECF subfamily)